jgi:hypothetical protein
MDMNEISRLLLQAIIRIPKAPTFLTSLILGSRQPVLSGNTKVKIQLYKAGQKLAPISTPAKGGVIMTHYGYDDIDIEAPLLAPEWDMTELHNTAAPGELTMLGSNGDVQQVTTEDRAAIWKGLKMAEGIQMIARFREWMIATQLTTGQIVLTGAGGYNVTIDIGFDNNVSVTNAWDADAGDPISDLQELRYQAIALGLPAPNVLVLSTTAGAAFMNNAKVQERLKLAVGQMDPIFGLEPLPGVAATRIGYIREIDTMVYTYGATWDNNGVSTPFIPAGTGVYVPSAAINNVCYAQGAIYDARDKSWFSGDLYPREYSRGDGHAEFLQLNSRPVNCLTEAESWYNLEGLVTSY